MMKVFFVLLVCAVAVYPTLTAPLPQQQTNNDPFSNLSRAFNQMAANTFGTAAAQHRQHSQQAQRPGVRPVIDRSSVSSGNGHHQFASSSVHSTGTGVSATAHASSSSHGTNQRKQKPNRASSNASQSSTSTRQGNRNQNRRTENTQN